ncbi:hypothetical protein PAPYR_10284 [Paratrimastix pyriformis]|uniref:Uncharacterized protein n=1 Tax=Paratrimastix pyriformis TaxID=342808 RepID=A0ABQ8U813_9EUKA|nr:hypothetical protein PAPYR_10284 [Paratrimastix pyriformis]
MWKSQPQTSSCVTTVTLTGYCFLLEKNFASSVQSMGDSEVVRLREEMVRQQELMRQILEQHRQQESERDRQFEQMRRELGRLREQIAAPRRVTPSQVATPPLRVPPPVRFSVPFSAAPDGSSLPLSWGYPFFRDAPEFLPQTSDNPQFFEQITAHYAHRVLAAPGSNPSQGHRSSPGCLALCRQIGSITPDFVDHATFDPTRPISLFNPLAPSPALPSSTQVQILRPIAERPSGASFSPTADPGENSYVIGEATLSWPDLENKLDRINEYLWTLLSCTAPALSLPPPPPSPGARSHQEEAAISPSIHTPKGTALAPSPSPPPAARDFRRSMAIDMRPDLSMVPLDDRVCLVFVSLPRPRDEGMQLKLIQRFQLYAPTKADIQNSHLSRQLAFTFVISSRVTETLDTAIFSFAHASSTGYFSLQAAFSTMIIPTGQGALPAPIIPSFQKFARQNWNVPASNTAISLTIASTFSIVIVLRIISNPLPIPSLFGIPAPLYQHHGILRLCLGTTHPQLHLPLLYKFQIPAFTSVSATTGFSDPFCLLVRHPVPNCIPVLRVPVPWCPFTHNIVISLDTLSLPVAPFPTSTRYCLFRTPPSPSLARSRVSIRPTPSDKVNSGFNRRLPSWQTFLLSILNHGGLTIFGISALPFFSEY